MFHNIAILYLGNIIGVLVLNMTTYPAILQYGYVAKLEWLKTCIEDQAAQIFVSKNFNLGIGGGWVEGPFYAMLHRYTGIECLTLLSNCQFCSWATVFIFWDIAWYWKEKIKVVKKLSVKENKIKASRMID